MKIICFFDSPVGKLCVAEDDEMITHILFGEDERVKGWQEGDSGLLKNAGKQLREYFEGRRKRFELPLRLEGTDFQKLVWNALADIPYGETRTYKDIAAAVGNPRSVRAVGMANNRNPVSIVIPCHRVVGSDGGLTGYGGGLPAKEILLKLERENL